MVENYSEEAIKVVIDFSIIVEIVIKKTVGFRIVRGIDIEIVQKQDL